MLKTSLKANISDSSSSEDDHANTDAANDDPSGDNDTGLWPAIIPEKMREYWVMNGP